MRIEEVPNIPMFRKNTAAFIHELAATSISNVDADSDYVRVQVLTNGEHSTGPSRSRSSSSSSRSWRRRPGTTV